VYTAARIQSHPSRDSEGGGHVDLKSVPHWHSRAGHDHDLFRVAGVRVSGRRPLRYPQACQQPQATRARRHMSPQDPSRLGDCVRFHRPGGPGPGGRSSPSPLDLVDDLRPDPAAAVILRVSGEHFGGAGGPNSQLWTRIRGTRPRFRGLAPTAPAVASSSRSEPCNGCLPTVP
jgi:hypothetical protein